VLLEAAVAVVAAVLAVELVDIDIELVLPFLLLHTQLSLVVVDMVTLVRIFQLVVVDIPLSETLEIPIHIFLLLLVVEVLDLIITVEILVDLVVESDGLLALIMKEIL
jgi:hypothetical protein